MPEPSRIDLFDSTYGNFETDVLRRVRKSAFGEDFGQNSWTTVAEFLPWIEWLRVSAGSRVLEVASGSGGPSIYLASKTGASVIGIDINDAGIASARQRTERLGMVESVRFERMDATQRLAFSDASFDAVICIDSANHLPDRLGVLREWARVLKPGGRLLFTDPVVLTGACTNDELQVRSSIGLFLFVPLQVTQAMVQQAGLDLERTEDCSEGGAAVARRWLEARNDDRDSLIQMEGEGRYEGLQRFFATVATLMGERRLSRFAFFARKPS